MSRDTIGLNFDQKIETSVYGCFKRNLFYLYIVIIAT